MGSRGRKSAVELSVIGPGGVSSARRPDPPSELTDEMREVWRTVVNGKPADWFDAGSAPVLAQYCRHVIAARRVAQLIAKIEREEEFDADLWNRLLRAQERQSAQIASLGTKMRLLPQSRYDARSAARAARRVPERPAPWES
ncbi:MAG TPA: hypothetical protein VLE70_05820 [Anaerolineae bacterium]|nr:hypothetical protein [Anaerolineae bacterium]